MLRHRSRHAEPTPRPPRATTANEPVVAVPMRRVLAQARPAGLAVSLRGRDAAAGRACQVEDERRATVRGEVLCWQRLPSPGTVAQTHHCWAEMRAVVALGLSMRRNLKTVDI